METKLGKKATTILKVLGSQPRRRSDGYREPLKVTDIIRKVEGLPETFEEGELGQRIVKCEPYKELTIWVKRSGEPEQIMGFPHWDPKKDKFKATIETRDKTEEIFVKEKVQIKAKNLLSSIAGQQIDEADLLQLAFTRLIENKSNDDIKQLRKRQNTLLSGFTRCLKQMENRGLLVPFFYDGGRRKLYGISKRGEEIITLINEANRNG